MKLIKVILVLCSLIYCCECTPVYPIPRWFDYEDFPVAKPILDTGSGTVQVVERLSPLRPYEPWIIECSVRSHGPGHEKEDNLKRHEQCQEIDEKNESDYALFILHIEQWEKQYPERAARWNARFPDAKDKEKKRYEQLKAMADSHKTIELEIASSSTPVSLKPTQRTMCPTSTTCERNNDAKKEGFKRKSGAT